MNEIEKKLLDAYVLNQASINSRRHFLKECTLGLGGIALGSLLKSCVPSTNSSPFEGERGLNPLAPLAPPKFPKVKNVIYLHMVCAPSQLEMFDYKPELHKLHDQLCPESLLK